MKEAVAFVNVIVLAGAAYFYWRKENQFRKLFWPALILKVIAGICLGVIYFEYYNGIGDTAQYFVEGSWLSEVARKDPQKYFQFLWSSEGVAGLANQAPRALFFTKLVSVFNILSYDNYWIISAYLSIISFASAWFLLKTISKCVPEVTIPAIIALLFFPSVVFWSSGVIKECVSTAATFFLVAIFLKIWFRHRVKTIEWLLAIVAVWILWALKYYILAVLGMAMSIALLYELVFRRFVAGYGVVVKLLICIALGIVLFFIVTFQHPNFHPEIIVQVIADNYYEFQKLSDPEDVISFNGLQPDFFNLLMHSPKAVFSGLYRPFLWEAGNLLQLVIALENFLLLAMSMFAIRYINPVFKSPHRLLVLMVLFYTIILCAFLTLSTPNFGTLSRYRVAFLPFFVLVLFSNRQMLNILNRSFGGLIR